VEENLEMEKHRHINPPIGLIVAAALFSAYFLAGETHDSIAGESPATASVWTVTSDADSGTGTLRQALFDASAGDTILFSPATFPLSSPVTITLAIPLPMITQNDLVIDASSAGVILDGSAVGGEMTPGLDIRADGVMVHGLQIVHFTGCGVKVRGQTNTIGGARQAGSALLGQGNLLGDNDHGGICLFDGAAYNTVVGNLVGVDVAGMQAWGNQGDGVHINGGHHNVVEGNVISSQMGAGVKICCSADSAYNTVRNNSIGVATDGVTPLRILDKGVVLADGANHNTIGPDNLITQGSYGVSIEGRLSPGNTILGNSIYDNAESGISLWNESMDVVHVPAIASFDLAAGTVAGVACPNCLVQLYSDEDNEGRVFEGQVTADPGGAFYYSKGSPLAGPHLTATATDVSGTTSMFSVPTAGVLSVPMQPGNSNTVFRIAVKEANQLLDNRIGTAVQDQGWVDSGMVDATVFNRLGVKWIHGAMNDPDRYLINWETDERVIHDNFDQMVTGLERNGIEMSYVLLFWDKEHYRQTGEISLPRFQTEEEIQRYLDFVRLMVGAFGDRVDYYELWNEPGHTPDCLDPLSVQCIPVETYITMGKRTIAVIREQDPGAKIVIPSYHGWDPPELYQQYLYPILSSDLMPLVDVIAWHPFIVHLDPEECGGEFFERYWGTVLPEIKSIATAHGFQGEFRADELAFRTRTPSVSDPCAVFDRTAGKYYAREIVHHLGEDVAAWAHGVRDTPAQIVQRLATLMAGARATSLPVEVNTTADVVSYTFALPNGDTLAAIWNDVDIADEDTAISVTLRLPGSAEDTAYGIDALSGIQQRLVASPEGGGLVVRDLLIKDYPLLVRLAPILRLYLPVVTRPSPDGR
jgi:hypothetical protein